MVQRGSCSLRIGHLTANQKREKGDRGLGVWIQREEGVWGHKKQYFLILERFEELVDSRRVAID